MAASAAPAAMTGFLSHYPWLQPEFPIFLLTLVAVVVFHRHALTASLAGMVLLVLYKLAFTDFAWIPHLREEGPGLVNLIGLLLGFAVLAKLFEESGLSSHLPARLPGGWLGGLALLGMVMILSSFLDNIAAALIGGSLATWVFRKRVHPGYLVALVAASNAGGAGSVVGDTTTTMMWIDGVPAVTVLHAFLGSLAAFLFFGIAGAIQQHRHQPIHIEPDHEPNTDWVRVAIVVGILAGAVAANVLLDFPALGVWAVLGIGMLFRRLPWGEVPLAAKGSFFLVALVFSASLLPVSSLPAASWVSAMIMGVASAFFGALPLTKLALEQGGYDWGFLAFAVGYGGSMIWFGSGAGVALAGVFPEVRSAKLWLRSGWHVPVGYLAGCVAIIAIAGWDPGRHAATADAHAAPTRISSTISSTFAETHTTKAENPNADQVRPDAR